MYNCTDQRHYLYHVIKTKYPKYTMQIEKLTHQEVKVVLGTSPTGLGHIRVTKALLDGLPENIQPEVIGIDDATVSFLYHIISTNIYLRSFFEFTQTNPIAEKLTTMILRHSQASDLKPTIKSLQKIIDNNPEIKKIVFVSTHPAIATKIQKIIKKKIFKIPILHTVIVTDDSPQRFWMIPADRLVVPSRDTLRKMKQQFQEDRTNYANIIVAPYPINPKYKRVLESHVLFNKQEQLDPDNPQRARVCIPISGAAVQLEFYKSVVEELTCESSSHEGREFTFSIITREGNFTQPFVDYFRNNSQVLFHIGANDLQTVQLYDELYEQLNPPTLEITKPSEQCFKVLTGPNTAGGPILLLTDPVGRQEHDNLKYLERFGFMPSSSTHEKLYQKLLSERKSEVMDFIPQARTWRALKLPSDPYEACKFIIACFQCGIFQAMQNFIGYTTTDEIAPNGVDIIWNEINSII
jgi:hypothetical protein